MSFPIYFDEDSQDNEVVTILRARGLIISTVNEQNMRQRKDDEQLAFATSKGWAIFSYNLPDFCRLNSAWLKAGKQHAGIIVAYQQRYHAGEVAGRITRMASALTSNEMIDRLEYLSNW